LSGRLGQHSEKNIFFLIFRRYSIFLMFLIVSLTQLYFLFCNFILTFLLFPRFEFREFSHPPGREWTGLAVFSVGVHNKINAALLLVFFLLFLLLKLLLNFFELFLL